MVTPLARTVFVGEFHHTVDEKNRVAIPAKWRAAAKGSRDFYVLPDPKDHLIVLPASEMDKMLEKASDISIGEYERRDVLRLIAGRAHATPCDKQGRITLTETLRKHAGIESDVVLVGALNKFEMWSPARLAQVQALAEPNFREGIKQLGL
jgi:MraZ protein